MWIGILKFEDKPLSSVELLVLVTVPDNQLMPVSTLIDQLKSSTIYWTPERGTVYPVIRRLEHTGLLIRDRLGKKMAVMRTAKGTSFLRARFPEIAMQLKAVAKYFETIVESTLAIDPIKAKDLLKEAETITAQMSGRLRELQKRANEIIVEEGWTEIQIE